MRVLRGWGTLVLLAVPACSSAGPGEALPPPAASIEDYLALLPAVEVAADETVVVRYTDIGRAEELAGVARPDDWSNERAAAEYYVATFSVVGSNIPVDHHAAALAPHLVEGAHDIGRPFAEEVGWTILDVDRFAEIGVVVGADATVLDGTFEKAAIDDALGEAQDDVWIAGDPERGSNLADVTPVRTTGEPLWFSLHNDRLLTATSDAAMQGLRDPSHGATAADDEVFVALARNLDGAQAYTAEITRLPDQTELSCLPALDGARGFGLSYAAENREPVLVLAVVYDEGTTASDRATQLSDWLASWSEGPGLPWPDLVAIGSASSRGSSAVVRLRLSDPSLSPNVWRAANLGPLQHLRDGCLSSV